jgi:hypothetical protein
MNEQQVIDIIFYIRLIILGLIIIGACLYTIPICLVRRFHKPNHLLTANVCIAVFIFSNLWTSYFVVNAYYPYIWGTEKSCLLLSYAQNVVVCQVNYALCMVSLNRLFNIIYKNKAFLHTKRWSVICISAQWIFATLIPLPILTSDIKVI